MTSGLSRRALFGLGAAHARRRFDVAAAPPPRPPDLAPRWLAHAAHPSPLWRPVGEALVAAAAPREGERVLAYGAAAPSAAGCTPAHGDPAAIPVPDAGFDVVLSAFAPQVTPDGLAALAELGRVVAPSGRVALAVWSAGVVPQLMRAVARVDPLPAGMPSPALWGSDERLRQDLDRYVGEPSFASHTVVLDFRDAREALGRLSAAVPPLAATGPGARAAMAPVLDFHLFETDAGVRLEVPYLVAVAERR